MKTSDFYYDLPEELIAQDPLEDRSASRLMHLDRRTGEIEHRQFRDIVDYLRKGDCLVINDTKVIPARLIGNREETGGVVEILLLTRLGENVWECLTRPGKKAREGARLVFGEGLLKGEIIEVMEDGNRKIRFSYEGIFEEILDQLGQMPLPPYITHQLKDKNRYQTVYATHEGSAAAPTAGLHFTLPLLKQIEGMGVSVARITLRVGLGTFRPVKAENIEDHLSITWCPKRRRPRSTPRNRTTGESSAWGQRAAVLWNQQLQKMEVSRHAAAGHRFSYIRVIIFALWMR